MSKSEARAWFGEKVPNAAERDQLREIKTADALCEQCYQGDELLCRGTRIYFSKDQSNQYGRFKVERRSCDRKLNLDANKALEYKYKQTGLPKSLLDKALLVKDLQLTVMPPLMHDIHSDVVDEYLAKAIIAHIQKGFVGKYVFTPILLAQFTDQDWKNIFTLLGSEVHFLAFARFDMGNAPSYKLDYIYQLIDWRKQHGRVTALTVGVNHKARNDAEKELYIKLFETPKITEEFNGVYQTNDQMRWQFDDSNA